MSQDIDFGVLGHPPSIELVVTTTFTSRIHTQVHITLHALVGLVVLLEAAVEDAGQPTLAPHTAQPRNGCWAARRCRPCLSLV